jgi:hypothetical protein
LLEQLLAGANVTEAAAAAGMSERTAYRRLGDPGFPEQLAAARKAVVSGVVARLAGSAEKVVAVMLELIESDSTPPSVRARSCQAWLQSLQEYGMSEDLAGRLGELEKAIEKLSERRAA